MPPGKQSNKSDLEDLARCLRQERLYVSYERKQLQQLNENVAASGRRLAQTSWSTSMQRDNLEGLIMSRPDSSPQHSCQMANLLDQTQFCDAYKILGHHMTVYSEFLASLRNNPSLIAEWLTLGDKLNLPYMKDIVMTVFTSLLGSCAMAEDETIMVTMLHKLVETQLLEAANPRKLLRHGTSSFSRMYKLFSDQLFSSRLFLTSAFYEPILSILTDDEIFLDIDPAKALIRFPPQEQIRRFGVEGTEEYRIAVANHRKAIISKLADHAQQFVMGIKNNLHSLPLFLSNLIRIIYNSMESRGIEPREIWAVCTDVLFNSFICPAIVDPEPKGITDMPISYIARFNLMQVAQILQVLALWKWEDINPAHEDLYQLFDKNLLVGLLDVILRGDGRQPDPSLTSGGHSTGRMAVLITADQLHKLTEWLNAARAMPGLEEEMKTRLNTLLIPLPPTVPGQRKVNRDKDSEAKSKDTEEAASTSSSGDITFQKHKAALAARLSSVGTRAKQQPSSSGSGQQSSSDSLSQSGPEKVMVVPITDSPSELPGLAGEEIVLSQARDRSHATNRVRLNLRGLLDGTSGNHFNREVSLSSAGEVQEKRTRFSLSHDDGSIGNTSDNLEAISEAASNHSVASSLEDEVDQAEQDQILDNMSDMVSANVSGRGTPNVSGRDTPSSQITEGEIEEREAAGGEVEPQPEPRQDNMREAQEENNVLNGNRKDPQQDIEEKFGRFDIKPEVRRGRLGQLMGSGGREGERDEAVSMVSDTWSTDVLSSDTETVGEPPTLEDLLRGRPGDEFSGARNRMLDQLQVPEAADARSSSGHNTSGHLLDIAETGSEAWSMDVLASDSESLRVADFDLEDSMSVARSDDTRFTDDTTRSDPDQINLQRLELSSEYEGRRKGVENWARSGGATTGNPARRRDSDGSGHSNKHESILKKPAGAASISTLPILVGEGSSMCLDDSAVTDGPPDISSIVSVVSVASSTSSQASAGSVEAVCPPNKSRSNSSTSAGGSLHGASAGLEVPVSQTTTVTSNTGAIPKSISFDKTADKDDDSHDGSGDQKQSIHSRKDTGSSRFFKNWKLPKMGRRGGGRGSKGDEFHRSGDNHHHHRLTSEAFNIPEHTEGPQFKTSATENRTAENESSEDILAKYRKKPMDDKVDGNDLGIVQARPDEDLHDLSVDRNNLEACFVFQDARRKLRLVLSEVYQTMIEHRHYVPDLQVNIPQVETEKGGELMAVLNIMLAQSINLQDRSGAAQIRETIRCVSLLEQDIIVKLVESLKEEYQGRSPYIAYLVKSRQGLLSSLATLDNLTARMENEQRMSTRFLITVCVRLFIERREDELQRLSAQFAATNMMDEKTDLVVSFLTRTWASLEQEPMFAATNEEQRVEARKAVERMIFGFPQLYMAALYPNQDADICRDQVLHQHIGHLSALVTPSHADLKIPRRYQYECPWPAAQAELRRLAAFKMPEDKVQCITNVSKIIMNLLSLAQDKSVPAADDFMPVLVFVIIKANPPSLLSTVQYVENFYRDRLQGEDCYWWMQFVGAVEFIKTMD